MVLFDLSKHRRRVVMALVAAGTAAAPLAVVRLAPSSHTASTAVESTAVESPAFVRPLGIDLAVAPGSSPQRSPHPPVTPSGALVYDKGRFRPLDAIPGANPILLHWAIDNRDRVVGSYIDAGARPGPTGYPLDAGHGFVQDRRGRVTKFDVPGGLSTFPNGINDRGQITGTYFRPGTTLGPDGTPPPNAARGFVRDRRGHVTTFSVPFPYLHAIYDINDLGQTVGSYDDPSRPYGLGGGFVRDRDGKITEIRVPGALNTTPRAINDRGQIAGVYFDRGATLNPDGTAPAGAIHGFVWDRGHITRLDVPGSLQTAAFAINDRGQISGGYTTADGSQRGFVRTGHRYTTIDAPGSTDNIALGINDHGHVIVPDPQAAALLPVAAPTP